MYPKTKLLSKKGYIFVDKLTERALKIMPSLADPLLSIHDTLKEEFPEQEFALQWDPEESVVVVYVRSREYGPSFMERIRNFRKTYKEQLENIFITTDFAYPEENKND